MSAPDPKTVREIAREIISKQAQYWNAAEIRQGYRTDPRCARLGNKNFTDLRDAVINAIVAATVTVSWPDEQQPADVVTAAQQQPWPHAQRMPLAVVGGRPQPWHQQAIAEYGTATGTVLEPNPTIPGGYTATQVNWAITWWNERAEAEQQQDGAVGPDLTYRVTQAYRAARFMRLDDDALIQGIVTAVLAERTALAARVAELESERSPCCGGPHAGWIHTPDCADLQFFDEERHARRTHPAYEYATTQGQRKAWDGINEPPEGEGWERNVDAGRNGWERFDYHEESYWRRLRPEAPQQPERDADTDGGAE